MNINGSSSVKCTGCMACLNVCPVHCIKIGTDKEGFSVPKVDEKACLGCSLCVQSCPAEVLVKKRSPQAAYAAQAKDWSSLRNSASGGLAFQLCQEAILDGGCAYGAAYMDDLLVRHVRAEEVEQLTAQQGSKYVQSDFSPIYPQVKADCVAGKKVVVVGTPCQLAGLRNYLKEDYDNLLLVDLICHGVPSPKLFAEYLSWKAKKMKAEKLDNYQFRDKSWGWGTNFKAAAGGAVQLGAAMEEPYYSDFVLAYSYRESCYQCQYACPERIGDITVGDYWGFSKFHPEYDMETEKGVSCVLVNTKKGQAALDRVADSIYLLSSTVEKVLASNSSLNIPAQKPEIRAQYYSRIEADGFGWSARRLRKNKAFYKSWIMRHVPRGLKRLMKRIRRAIG